MTADHVQAERQNNMATKKSAVKKPAVEKETVKKSKSKYPIVTIGSHSIRTEYENGKVDFVVDDVKLHADVMAALAEAEALRKSFPLAEEKKPAKTARTKKAK